VNKSAVKRSRDEQNRTGFSRNKSFHLKNGSNINSYYSRKQTRRSLRISNDCEYSCINGSILISARECSIICLGQFHFLFCFTEMLLLGYTRPSSSLLASLPSKDNTENGPGKQGIAFRAFVQILLRKAMLLRLFGRARCFCLHM
jgi:hypothetical protein